jgi:hypothetical protein
MFSKGAKKGQQCDIEVSEKSSSGLYCSKHFAQNEKEEAKRQCIYTHKKGAKANEVCGKAVSSSDSCGKFCAKHLAFGGESVDSPYITVPIVPPVEQKPVVNGKPKISIKTVKSGALKGKHSCEYDGVVYIVDKPTLKVVSRVENDCEVPLSDADQEALTEYGMSY